MECEILDLQERVPTNDELYTLQNRSTTKGCGCICYVQSGENNIEVVGEIIRG